MGHAVPKSAVCVAPLLLGALLSSGCQFFFPNKSSGGGSAPSGDGGSVAAPICSANPPSTARQQGNECLVKLVPGLLGANIKGVAVDANRVYFSDENDGTIKSVPLNGGVTTTLATRQINPCHVKINATHVFWTNEVGGPGISSVPLTGGPVQVIYQHENTQSSCPLAIDASNLYTVVADGAVVKVPLSGGTPITLAIAGEGYAWYAALDNDFLYWAATKPQTGVWRVPTGGGTPAELVPTGTNNYGIVVDSSQVYWLDNWESTVNSMPIGGGSATVIAKNQVNPFELAEDADSLYWTDWAGNGTSQGAVVRMAKSGGSPSTLTITDNFTAALAVDQSAVYFNTTDGIWKITPK